MITVVIDSEDHYADTTALFDYGRAITAFALAGGGGADLPDLFLAEPPAPPDLGAFTAPLPPPLSADPRNGVAWIAAMVVLAALTVMTMGVRRRDPLQEAAEMAWRHDGSV